MLGDELCAGDRNSAFTTEVGLGHQTTQPAPTGTRVKARALPAGQHCDPRMSGIDLGAAPGWIDATRLDPSHCNSVGFLLPYSQIHPQHRSDAGLVARLHETHRAIKSIAVGQGQRGLAQRRGTLHQCRRSR